LWKLALPKESGGSGGGSELFEAYRPIPSKDLNVLFLAPYLKRPYRASDTKLHSPSQSKDRLYLKSVHAQPREPLEWLLVFVLIRYLGNGAQLREIGGNMVCSSLRSTEYSIGTIHQHRRGLFQGS
jgi:hypothetical protein